MRYPSGYYEQQYNFDFFNYAGIHRPVILYTTVKFCDLKPLFWALKPHASLLILLLVLNKTAQNLHRRCHDKHDECIEF